MPEYRNAYQDSIAEVRDKMAYLVSVSERWTDVAGESIEALGGWEPLPEGTPPNITVGVIHQTALPELPAPNPQLFGDVGNLTVPSLDDLSSLVGSFDPYDVGPFSPTTGLPTIPSPPSPIDTSGVPTKPTLNTITTPSDPDYPQPVVGEMQTLTLPSVPTINIPTFDVDEIPLFETPPPPLELHWTEQPYQPLVQNELTVTIKAMLDGGFAMHPVVELALFAAVRDREETIVRAALDDARDEWAGRGFDMPPGMLAERINDLRDKHQLAMNAVSRDVHSKAAQWQIENLRTAVAQGIALEGIWTQHWDQLNARALEAARAVVELTKDGYNLLVIAFNTKLASIQAKREVFEALLRAELAKIEIFKAQIEGEALKGQINEQTVRIYTAQLEGVRVIAQIFGEKINAAKLRADIELSKLAVYKTEVDAWSTRIQADKVRFDAYEAQTRGAAALVGAYEAESRAYAAQVSAAGERNNSRLAIINARMRAIEISVQKFLGELQSGVAQIAARRDAIAARAQAWGADVAYSSEKMKYLAQGEEIKVRVQEGNVRNNLAYFETISRQFDAQATRVLARGNAIQAAMAAVAQTAAQLSAGATSAIHVQAGIQGSGSVTESYNHSYNETPTADPAE